MTRLTLQHQMALICQINQDQSYGEESPNYNWHEYYYNLKNNEMTGIQIHSLKKDHF